jgi:hypothetical protein
LFPLLPEDELTALAKDIKENRLREKVAVLTKGSRQMVIDGRNRLDALELAGFTVVDERGGLVKSVCIDLTKGGDLDLVDPAKVEAFIISKSIHRRHLAADQKRDLIAKPLKANPERSDRATGKLAKADKNTVAAVREDLEASGEIHQSEMRVSASGQTRKPAKKSALRDQQPPPAGRVPASEPAASALADQSGAQPELVVASAEAVACSAQPPRSPIRGGARPIQDLVRGAGPRPTGSG